MALLIGCFVAAMLFVLAVAEFDNDDDEPETELDSRIWINWLADQSQRRKPKTRGRYSVSGVQK